MAYDFSGVSIAWAAAALVVALCWPISQALRHERLRPIAAFLLFTSAFILVAAISSAILLLGGSLLLPAGALDGIGPAAVVGSISLLAAFGAAFWIVRSPQRRRPPQ